MSQKSDTQPSGFPAANLVVYQEAPGNVPFLDFYDSRKKRKKADILAALERLRQFGHALRPPYNEHLGDQMYYLRIPSEDGAYRIFYWPHGKGVVILGHGFSKKERTCPPGEITAREENAGSLR